jgi:GET complex subunit GET2
MSTAAAKAEARRKAILARGNDRLAKLTTSARGEDAAFVHDGVSVRLSVSEARY